MEVDYVEIRKQFSNAIKEILSKQNFDEASSIIQSKIASKFPPIPEYATTEEKKKGLSSEQKQEVKDIETVRIELKSILELILRPTLDDVVTSSIKKDGKPDLKTIDKILELSIQLPIRDLLDSATVFYLIEDILECNTIEACETIFPVIESKAEKLSQPMFVARKGTILRPVLEFLRRMSRSSNPRFSGQILAFLGYILPLYDKSGLNTKGEITSSELELEPEPLVEYMESEDASEVSHSFYLILWSLQNFFKSPYEVLKAENWSLFVRNVDIVLGTFQSNFNLSETEGLNSFDPTHFTPYQPAMKLLKLQLRDPLFRKHILSQLWILLHTLLNPLKEKIEPLKDKQRSVIIDYTKQLRIHLEKNSEDGKKFVADIQRILDRENNWIKWKKEGCPSKPFDKAPISKFQTKRKAEGEKNSENSKKIRFGSAQLSRLWNLTVNEEFLTLPERTHTPTVQEFLRPIEQEMDPKSGIDEEDKRKHDKIYNWKALRLIAKNKLHYLSKIMGGGGLEEAVRLLEAEKGAFSKTEEQNVTQIVPSAQETASEKIDAKDGKNDTTMQEASKELEQ